MAAFYMDENVPPELSAAIRALGHDILTAQDDGRAGRGIDDPLVLERAIELALIVVTNNRWDYHPLHDERPDHTGIVTFTNDSDRAALALRIHDAVTAQGSMAGVLVKIVKPNPGAKS